MRLTRPHRVSVPARVSLALGLPVCLAVAVVGLAQPAHAAATITVSTCDESDLDAAVAQANSDNAGDTITFGCSGTISLSSTLEITGGMTLDGTGQQVALAGGGSSGGYGVLSVASGVSFTLNALTVTGGGGGGGGGLFNNGGTVTITNSTFRDNEALAGAGVLNRGGTVTITGSTFEANIDFNGDGTAVNNIDGTVNITGSLFTENLLQAAGNPSAVINGPRLDDERHEQ